MWESFCWRVTKSLPKYSPLFLQVRYFRIRDSFSFSFLTPPCNCRYRVHMYKLTDVTSYSHVNLGTSRLIWFTWLTPALYQFDIIFCSSVVLFLPSTICLLFFFCLAHANHQFDISLKPRPLFYRQEPKNWSLFKKGPELRPFGACPCPKLASGSDIRPMQDHCTWLTSNAQH